MKKRSVSLSQTRMLGTNKLCHPSARWTSGQGRGTALSQYHWQVVPLRYGRYLARRRFATAGGASWNGAGVERAGAAQWREDPASMSFFVFRPEKPMGTEVALAG